MTGVGYGELVDIRDANGRIRHGQVKSLSEKATLVQVFTGTGDLVPNTTKVRFLGKPLEVHLSKYMLGRTFNGLGEPRDGCGEIYGGKRVNINGLPLNPMARQYPRDFIHTGISAIDTLMTLIPRTEAAYILGQRTAAQPARGTDSDAGEGRRLGRIRRRLRGHRRQARRRGLLHAGALVARTQQQHRNVPQPRGRPRHRAYRDAANGALDRGVPSHTSSVCTSSS